MTFVWPLALLTLAAVPLALAAQLLLRRRRARHAVRHTNLAVLAAATAASPRWRRHLPLALALLALALMAVALARPQVSVAVPRERATVLMVMDVSGSMRATDVEPSRLAAAQRAARRFVGGLPEEFRVGVVSFSSVAQVVIAPTDDHAAAQAAIDVLYADGGTAIGDALDRAVEQVRTAEPTAAGRAASAVVLLSDGANTDGVLTPQAAAERAREARVQVHTVALGTEDGRLTDSGRPIPVPPDPRTLAAVAQTTGGRFYEADDADALSAVYDEVGRQVASEREPREVTAAFAGAGALVLLAGATLSALWLGRLP